MCVVCTGQVQTSRRIDKLNITVKDNPSHVLAPTWDLVMGVKRDGKSQEWYTNGYKDLLRKRYGSRRQEFLDVLRNGSVTLLCYCEPGAFCHRHIAVDILESIARKEGIAFKRGGEI